MPIVSGRNNSIDVDDRKCNLCDIYDHFNRIGYEVDYLLNCPFFREDRTKYLNPLSHEIISSRRIVMKFLPQVEGQNTRRFASCRFFDLPS